MLFGLIKSAKEKAQEDYKKALHHKINMMKEQIYMLKANKSDTEALVWMMTIRQVSNKVVDLRTAILDDLSPLQQRVTRKNNAYFMTEDYKNEENTYLENEYIDLHYKFLEDFKELKITEEARKRWNLYYVEVYQGF